MDTHIYAGPMSLDEYLRVEEASPERHEYVRGEMYLLSGVTTRHNRLTRRIVAALDRAAGNGPCEVLFVDVKVRAADDRIYYPDVMTVCTPLPGATLVVRDPCLVVEVTSPSTRRIDLGEKLDAYRAIPSLQSYLIVEQRERRVDRHWRDAGGAWRHDVVTDAASGVVPIPCPETSLSLGEIYDGIELGDEEA